MQTDLFSPTVFRLNLTPAQLELVKRPVKAGPGAGGWQSFLAELQGRLRGSTLEMTEAELEKAYRHGWAYDDGGFEDRFRAICSAGWAAGWKGPK